MIVETLILKFLTWMILGFPVDEEKMPASRLNLIMYQGNKLYCLWFKLLRLVM
ncbi:unnamed protein product [Musa acuminata subsp. malaccensis]|uniref:(wild Malaysian banana) hypothetical protein n=1 Tax=Musa acuminata subsp. malaccensis TaxID=214687 RepID=A0A804KR30_MUSAM|nr:unnamed protein product [Musa acuminata subsp. malaccensis]